jgi:gamma-glutamylcyclotransferase (GGCT)/AIG2-like uncharacterized protein YtfP
MVSGSTLLTALSTSKGYRTMNGVALAGFYECINFLISIPFYIMTQRGIKLNKVYWLCILMNILTYGSLMFPPVMKAVTGREFPSRKARVKDYARFKVKGESYPGLIPLVGTVTEGVLYLNVDALSVRRLDDFEGEMYQRVEVQADGLEGESITAHAYVLRAKYRNRLSSSEWDPMRFEANDLREFMASYRGFNRTDRSDQS